MGPTAVAALAAEAEAEAEVEVEPERSEGNCPVGTCGSTAFTDVLEVAVAVAVAVEPFAVLFSVVVVVVVFATVFAGPFDEADDAGELTPIGCCPLGKSKFGHPKGY